MNGALISALTNSVNCDPLFRGLMLSGNLILRDSYRKYGEEQNERKHRTEQLLPTPKICLRRIKMQGEILRDSYRKGLEGKTGFPFVGNAMVQL